ncbi:STAS domain-containing protein [Gilvimarinus chinensis]|uniref:STAS domain-containing protein n=1 Tax=Gilvimarinus chinensis TaxID=396005 RepID=UPI00037C1E1D|nr:STAS domain-containing protein [Gilvimarinus chinensis]
MKNSAPFIGNEYLTLSSDKKPLKRPRATATPQDKCPPQLDWHPINNGHGIKVYLAGDLTLSALTLWRKFIRETANNGIHQFELDFKGVHRLSLAGLAILLLFKESKQAQPSNITLTQCNEALYKRLAWSGLTEEFIVRPTRKL